MSLTQPTSARPLPAARSSEPASGRAAAARGTNEENGTLADDDGQERRDAAAAATKAASCQRTTTEQHKGLHTSCAEEGGRGRGEWQVARLARAKIARWHKSRAVTAVTAGGGDGVSC